MKGGITTVSPPSSRDFAPVDFCPQFIEIHRRVVLVEHGPGFNGCDGG